MTGPKTEYISGLLVLTLTYIFDFTFGDIVKNHFPVTKNNILDPIGCTAIYVKSSLACASKCSSSGTCCYGSFDKGTNTCRLSTSCTPTLLSLSGGVTFRKATPSFNIQNGVVVISGSTAQVTCNAGYTLCGSSVLTYTAVGTWNKPYPVCFSSVGSSHTLVYNGRTYMFVTNIDTQPNAVNYCRSQGFELFDITSADENAFIKCAASAIDNGIGWWTGFTAFTPGIYTWCSGTPVTFTNWASAPTLSQQGSCAKFDQHDGLWYERSTSTCTYKLPFVCKF